MVDALVDTSIVVDLLRGYPVAIEWLSMQSQLGVTRFVWIEALEGAPNKQKQADAIKLLSRFDLVPTLAEDIDWASGALTQHGLAHGVDGYDCLIAAASHPLQLPLYTRNMKHFAPLIGVSAIKPY